MTIDVVRHRANGMSRVFWVSIWGLADEIDANNASPAISHVHKSYYLLRTVLLSWMWVLVGGE